MKVGDHVEPKPEWRGLVEPGRVTKVIPWGKGQVVYVDGQRRGHADYVYELAPRRHSATRATRKRS